MIKINSNSQEAIDLWSPYTMKRSQSVAYGLSFRAYAIAFSTQQRNNSAII
ncbi:MAG: hypothetical protein F6J98_27115 [Moorea sp. SIO4G2]|uniref:hypothetical protein n=1 Tax=unclassified Moorena TaxID=2683338 RepID=UPI0013F7A509|nr:MULTISPECIES: hypothetical protein [unclassified Moorena]NEO11248.1 hypothetical protein [Moorena sp. SIO3E8]NEO63899.1 hypothetical protein [Moorena sp. SIO4G2]NEP98839.1 hypothetical protein [Moorena sp. SIO3F7]